jgi:hypothetical protein
MKKVAMNEIPDWSTIRLDIWQGGTAMFCPKCGSLNPDDARFCGNCSAQLATKPPPEPAPKAEEIIDVTRDGVDVSPALKYGLGIAAFLIPIIGLVMGIIYLSQGETESKKDVGKFWLIASAAGFIFYLALSGDI